MSDRSADFLQTSLTSSREVIRKNTHPALFFILNVTFISFIQSVLLFLLTSPTYTILLASRIEPSISQADIAFTAVELGLVLSEYISDGQQWGRCQANS